MKKSLLTIFFFFISTGYAINNNQESAANQTNVSKASNNSNVDIAINSNAAFQEFENEYNLGFGYENGGLINGAHQTASYNENFLNLEVERLFNNGIWLDGNFNMVTGYSQDNLSGGTSGTGGGNGGNGSGSPFGQNPFMYGFNLKGGYGFQLVTNTLQIIPYAMFGRNSNLANSTVAANGGYNSIADDYFLSGGLGTRLNYRINKVFMLYADELYQYNWDNSGAIKSIQSNVYGKSYAATNYELTSTLGAKFNIWENLQLGMNGFWTNYQPQSNISGLIYTPNNIFGMMATIGLTY